MDQKTHEQEMNTILTDPFDQLLKEVKVLTGFALSETQIQSFHIYEQELLLWNEKINLTAIRDIDQIRRKHFLDSLSCMLAFGHNPPKSLIDIGSGAGFPGIPLKIVFPQLKLTLVESIGKKTKFLSHLTETLGLSNVEVIQSRAEELGQLAGYRERYDWAVARAVASLPVLVEYLLPFVRQGGGVIAQKGGSAPAETHSSQHAIRVLGGRLRQLIPISLPGVAEERYLVIIDKTAATPAIYPRKPGIPAKKPL